MIGTVTLMRRKSCLLGGRKLRMRYWYYEMTIKENIYENV